MKTVTGVGSVYEEYVLCTILVCNIRSWFGGVLVMTDSRSIVLTSSSEKYYPYVMYM